MQLCCVLSSDIDFCKSGFLHPTYKMGVVPSSVRGGASQPAYLVVLKELETFLVGAVPSYGAQVDQSVPELNKGASIFREEKVVTLFHLKYKQMCPLTHLFLGMSMSAM